MIKSCIKIMLRGFDSNIFFLVSLLITSCGEKKTKKESMAMELIRGTREEWTVQVDV